MARALYSEKQVSVFKFFVSCAKSFNRVVSTACLVGDWAERVSFIKFVDVVLDAAAFAVEESFDRIGKRLVGEPVGRPGPRRQEAAGHFMLTLRAAFEDGDFLLDAELKRLVIRGFKVQAWHVFELAPVASEQRLFVMDHHR